MTETKEETKKTGTVALDLLRAFPGHPYKVEDDGSMAELCESILLHGVIYPILIRPIKDGLYEIVSGHRRVHACRKLGMTEIPAIIQKMTREEAILNMVDSNLHRERILPSEKAFAYKMKAEALNHQGNRTDITSERIAPKLSTEIIAEQVGTSKDVVKRYIRLTNLIPELLDMMDGGQIAFSVGVELSFLDEDLQYVVLDACEEYDCTPSYAQAVRMHKGYNAGTLDPDVVYLIMSEEKANQHETVKLPYDRIKLYIPSRLTPKQLEDFIVKALEFHHRYQQRQRDDAR